MPSDTIVNVSLDLRPVPQKGIQTCKCTPSLMPKSGEVLSHRGDLLLSFCYIVMLSNCLLNLCLYLCSQPWSKKLLFAVGIGDSEQFSVLRINDPVLNSKWNMYVKSSCGLREH